MSAKLARIVLRVRDLDRSTRFYTGLLGMRVTSQTGGSATLADGASACEIALYADTGGPVPPVGSGCRSIGFEVPTKAALASACDRLSGARAVVLDSGGVWSVHTSDPDGTALEIFCRTGDAPPAVRGTRTRALSLGDLRTAALAEVSG